MMLKVKDEHGRTWWLSENRISAVMALREKKGDGEGESYGYLVYVDGLYSLWVYDPESVEVLREWLNKRTFTCEKTQKSL